MDLHLSVTAHLVHGNKALLVFHKKLQMWLAPGGHVDANETADQAAVREVQEELGIPVRIVSAQPEPARTDTRTLPVPFFCEVHDVGDHQHWNLAYLALPLSLPENHNAEELEQFRWFSPAELESAEIHPSVRARSLRALELLGNRMGFHESVVPQLAAGKTKTYRLRDHGFSVGDVIAFENSQTRQLVGHGTIIAVERTTVGQINLQDKAHHKTYNTVEELIGAFKRHHPDKATTRETPAWIYTYAFTPAGAR